MQHWLFRYLLYAYADAYLFHSVAGVLLVSPSAAIVLFVAPTDQPVTASCFALAHTDVLLILLGCPAAFGKG
jgi:hypothetical protein